MLTVDHFDNLSPTISSSRGILRDGLRRYLSISLYFVIPCLKEKKKEWRLIPIEIEIFFFCLPVASSCHLEKRNRDRLLHSEFLWHKISSTTQDRHRCGSNAYLPKMPSTALSNPALREHERVFPGATRLNLQTIAVFLFVLCPILVETKRKKTFNYNSIATWQCAFGFILFSTLGFFRRRLFLKVFIIQGYFPGRQAISKKWKENYLALMWIESLLFASFPFFIFLFLPFFFVE